MQFLVPWSGSHIFSRKRFKKTRYWLRGQIDWERDKLSSAGDYPFMDYHLTLLALIHEDHKINPLRGDRIRQFGTLIGNTAEQFAKIAEEDYRRMHKELHKDPEELRKRAKYAIDNFGPEFIYQDYSTYRNELRKPFVREGIEKNQKLILLALKLEFDDLSPGRDKSQYKVSNLDKRTYAFLARHFSKVVLAQKRSNWFKFFETLWDTLKYEYCLGDFQTDKFMEHMKTIGSIANRWIKKSKLGDKDRTRHSDVRLPKRTFHDLRTMFYEFRPLRPYKHNHSKHRIEFDNYPEYINQHYSPLNEFFVRIVDELIADITKFTRYRRCAFCRNIFKPDIKDQKKYCNKKDNGDINCRQEKERTDKAAKKNPSLIPFYKNFLKYTATT